MKLEYRSDIDGLRALAVISVILFHLGYLTNGYLGVDVFFVISGYLITSIVFKESVNNKFSILDFYKRRLRRIIPLLLFVSAVALVLGIILMLPEDLENLSQAVIASNLSVNNILMYITSSNYWAGKNDFKPLMHTWSLGIEEQFYLIYPFIFSFFKGTRARSVVYVIGGLTMLSLAAFFIQDNEASRFYLIQYRFFELSIGGLGAILFAHKKFEGSPSLKYLLYLLVVLLVVILAVPLFSKTMGITLAITLITTGILVLGNSFYGQSGVYPSLFSNPVAAGIGKISFSLYMWHQVVFAFARYSFFAEISSYQSVALIALVVGLSMASYYFIEKPFRDKQVVPLRYVFAFTGVLLIFTTGPALYIQAVGGAIKDFPDLAMKQNRSVSRNPFKASRNPNIKYNDDVKLLDTDFSNDTRRKILVIGNSFGRDVANIILEYTADKNVELKYFDINRIDSDSTIKARVKKADLIFIATMRFVARDYLDGIAKKYGFTIDNGKVWAFGTKDFGYSNNGIHHRRYSQEMDFTTYYTPMKNGIAETNEKLKNEWKDRYIDLIEVVSTDGNQVLVYTPSGVFISHDTLHLTRAGVLFFVQKLRSKLDLIFTQAASGGQVN